MTSLAWIHLALFLGILLLLAWPLSRWLTAVAQGRLPRWMQAVEGIIYRAAGIQPGEDMHWKRYALALLLFNFIGLLAAYGLQRMQVWLPLNPQAMAAVSPDSAFNTAVSFVTNTNWQGYGGESTMSYLTQMLVMTVQNFVSGATGIAVAFALVRGFASRLAGGIGNFWTDITRITLWVLVPLSFVFALFLVGQGVIQNLSGYQEVATVEATSYQQGKLDAQGFAKFAGAAPGPRPQRQPVHARPAHDRRAHGPGAPDRPRRDRGPDPRRTPAPGLPSRRPEPRRLHPA